jgi:DNA gyrase/topoisomerase IV subunit A
MYKGKVSDITEKPMKISQFFKVPDIIDVRCVEELNKYSFIYFGTQGGYIKKSNVNDYNFTGRNGTKCLKLRADDKVVNVLLSNDEGKLCYWTDLNNPPIKITKPIKPTGIATMGTQVEKERKILTIGEEIVV